MAGRRDTLLPDPHPVLQQRYCCPFGPKEVPCSLGRQGNGWRTVFWPSWDAFPRSLGGTKEALAPQKVNSLQGMQDLVPAQNGLGYQLPHFHPDN
jgi:hypothetical protein